MHHSTDPLHKDERGATAIEYGLVAAGVAVAIAAAVFTLGGNIAGMFGSVSDVVAPAEQDADAPGMPQRVIDRDRGNRVDMLGGNRTPR